VRGALLKCCGEHHRSSLLLVEGMRFLVVSSSDVADILLRWSMITAGTLASYIPCPLCLLY
jgi:hypothetical protein